MHLTAYFISDQANELNNYFRGGDEPHYLAECYSQNRDEVIFGFANSSNEFYIKASFDPKYSFLSFHSDQSRANRNSVELFTELLDKKVVGVSEIRNERAFTIDFTDGFRLLFKLFGNRSNILLFKEEELISLFRNDLQADKDLNLNDLGNVLDLSTESIIQRLKENKPPIVLWDKDILKVFKEKTQAIEDINDQAEAALSLHDELSESDQYSVIFDQEKSNYILSLLNPEHYENDNVKFVTKDPLEASTKLFYSFIGVFALSELKKKINSYIDKRLKQTRSYIKKSEKRLEYLENEARFRQFGDILMANMHSISPGIKKVELQDFYNNNQLVEIPLKKGLSPQKNAENYYRKAKNQEKEIEMLFEKIEESNERIDELDSLKKFIQNENDLKALKKTVKNLGLDSKGRQTEIIKPYKPYEKDGFQIWVGKNASANDELTLKYGYKEDLWLHAKDVPGSHVLIKHQSGREIPRAVIEYAAALAAKYSKRKNETLCPVIVTPKKYIRKVKGSPAGAVKVDKEEAVLMIEPAP
ncbi:NFACT RNA binding domain-containing protein [Mangrovivirga sp. M17]|uniref:NFACT RNA binding domain-containing protein n=1 Tax=Mangrovivirga halotolerans TaxID=2993936 RepID=A0ABT3RMA9_9BACT|nr:NFACT RNA binding domain-containing protein [Mangrovivirga halotolerans]MCX2742417.1 NFACT RNA binding domain-containing protein [Mangrovivirga halotolerans]